MKIAIVSVAVISTLASFSALGQQTSNYPQKPIRVIVPYSPGGGTDIVGRVVAQQLSATIGQQVVVENRGGAAGMTGTVMVAKSAPDGYTLLMTSGAPIVTNLNLFSKIAYDPILDFTPVTLVSTYSSILLMHPSVPVHTVKDLIAFAKSRPGQLNFASGGIGTTQHLSGEMLKDMTGINIVHVPYKGSGPAIIDLVGGHVSLYFSTPGSALPFIKSGKARALAVTSAKRFPSFPELPTVAETVPGFEAVAWIGLLAPSGTPREIVTKLRGEVVKALENPDARNVLAAQDYGVVGSTPEEFVDFIKKDMARWAVVIKNAGIKAE
ncbi:MAG: tripartite tricarboxylate transporter substrate binding protein [Betaproteobacteria bacterium]|nr:tripartite tricarboxylate transporter substrate binding protein [Betaproteobacteria bacterium]